MTGNSDKERWIIGIDEAGRGPLAGPVYVGAVAVPADYNFLKYKKLRDSKKMTERQREAVWVTLRDEVEKGNVRATYSYSQASTIDREGIVRMIEESISRALQSLVSEIGADKSDVHVLLDGGLHAATEFANQDTVVGGDDIEPSISLAAVLAKVERDRKMIRFNKKYPEYGFDSHKGYGTKRHREAIISYGLCDIHRRSFCGNFL